MIEDIRNYLDSPGDYFTGVALYERFGHSQSLKRLLRVGGDTTSNSETLAYELRKLAALPPVKSIPASKKPSPPPLVHKVDVQIRRDNTPEADQCRSDVVSKLKIRDHLHASLSLVRSEQDRCQAALQILDLSDKIDEDYQRLDHFNTHGILPAEKEKIVPDSSDELTPFQLFQRQKTLRTYVSRYERLSKSSKSLKMIAKNRENLAKYHLELEEINRLINESVQT